MKFKIDENLPVEVADLLYKAGYDAATVVQQKMGGSPDIDIISVCKEEGLILITLDTDFADILAYPPKHFPGLIVLRLQLQDKPHILKAIDRLIPMISSEPIKHLLWIVETTRLRIRS